MQISTTIEQDSIILSIIKQVLKEPKKESVGLKQFEFNCPSNYCKNDINKYNLTFNVNKRIFNCWKCKYSGFVHKLISDYGTQEQQSRISLVLPFNSTGNTFDNKSVFINKSNFSQEENENTTCELPEGYIPLTNCQSSSKYFYLAMKYLKSRKISEETIKKYQIGYTEVGPRKFRIIVPSFNEKGNCNYYEARSYLSYVKLNYYKPESPHKKEIIFNVSNINFDLPVYLVEGVFDMFPLYNCIPLLGKDVSDILLYRLIKHKTKVVICLDSDATKDTVEIYKFLESKGIDVYFIDIDDKEAKDIAKFYELYGQTELIKLLKTAKKIDFDTIFKMSLKDINRNKYNVDEKFLEDEWKKLQDNWKKESEI